MKTKLSLVIILLASVSVPVGAQSDDVCGSAAKYQQTKRWQDLPGCATLGWVESDANRRLNFIKYYYKEFYDSWNTEINRSRQYFGTKEREYRLGYLQPGVLYPDVWKNEPLLVAMKPLYEEAYREIVQRLKWFDIMENDTDSLNPSIGTIGRETRSEKPDAVSIRVAIDHIVPILEKLKAAAAPDELIIGRVFDKNYTIAEIRTLVPTWRGSVAAIAAKEQSDFAAKWQPFLAVLKGDRLELFKKYEVGILQGAGGRTLRTPAEFQRTSFMAKYTNGRSGILNRWNMTIWRFRGDKIIATQTKSGWGDDPPSAAFR